MSQSQANIIIMAITNIDYAVSERVGQYNISGQCCVCPGFIVTDLNRHDGKKVKSS